MIRTQLYAGLLALLAVTLAWQADGAGKIGKSDTKVKAAATATKAGADGKQTVTITLDIEKGWHLYANPVNHNNDFLDSNQTTVKVAAKGKVKFAVKYPVGKTKIDKKEKYDVYEGRIKIQAEVLRTQGDTSPLEILVGVSACDNSVCLAPGTVKLMLP
jgi:DsbC/DsbD-like thiol-disulfide interchange protein